MMTTPDLRRVAEQALACMRAQGFDEARVDASRTQTTELNVAHNEPSLLRSLASDRLVLTGLLDGRLAGTELGGLDALTPATLAEAAAALHADTRAAPQDAAHALTAGQRVQIEQGPQACDESLLADKVGELLAFRAGQMPAMMIEEGFAAHTRVQSLTLSSGGSELCCALGWYALSVLGTAREGRRTSSFNSVEGRTDDLRTHKAQQYFGINALMRELPRQIDTRPIAGKFVGEVVLTPAAVASLLGWLLGQVGDISLLSGSSLYRERVGQVVASPLLTLRSRFDAPGVAAVSADGFAAAPIEVLRAGRLVCLTPSLYASRRTGLAHVPVAASGWLIETGATPLAEMLAAVPRGALVGRLSMGAPAANGEFSGVIKNSFLIEGGVVGPALREVMVSGNVADMLREVAAVSRECLDTGTTCLPWLRIGGLHFS